MKIKSLLLFLIIPTIVVAGLLVYSNTAMLGEQPGSSKKTATAGSQQQTALPTDLEFLKIFFDTVNSKNMPFAMNMLDPSFSSTEESKKTWESYLSSFKSIALKNTEEANKNEWTDIMHIYKVTLTVETSEEYAKATIPYFGYDNGDNIRWITLKKGGDNLWRVAGFATGM